MKGMQLPLVLLATITFALSVEVPAVNHHLNNQNSRSILFHRSEIPANWDNIGASNPKKEIRFFIALKQRNVHLLEESIYRVAHPSSPHYGEYLTYQQVFWLDGRLIIGSRSGCSSQRRSR
jgi:subtilase family serine protease